MGAAYRASAVCVFEHVRGKSPTTTSTTTSSLLSSLSFLFSFFSHHIPSFKTQYQTLDGLCCHSKGRSDCESALDSLKKHGTKARAAQCSTCLKLSRAFNLKKSKLF